jgi:hypothetical protein
MLYEDNGAAEKLIGSLVIFMERNMIHISWDVFVRIVPFSLVRFLGTAARAQHHKT